MRTPAAVCFALVLALVASTRRRGGTDRRHDTRRTAAARGPERAADRAARSHGLTAKSRGSQEHRRDRQADPDRSQPPESPQTGLSALRRDRSAGAGNRARLRGGAPVPLADRVLRAALRPRRAQCGRSHDRRVLEHGLARRLGLRPLRHRRSARRRCCFVDEGLYPALNDMVVVAETALAATALASVMTLASSRPRPFLYGEEAPLARAQQRRRRVVVLEQPCRGQLRDRDVDVHDHAEASPPLERTVDRHGRRRRGGGLRGERARPRRHALHQRFDRRGDRGHFARRLDPVAARVARHRRAGRGRRGSAAWRSAFVSETFPTVSE